MMEVMTRGVRDVRRERFGDCFCGRGDCWGNAGRGRGISEGGDEEVEAAMEVLRERVRSERPRCSKMGCDGKSRVAKRRRGLPQVRGFLPQQMC